jgi:hypothetical protein
VLIADTYTSVPPELFADFAEATAHLVLADAAQAGRRPRTTVRSGPRTSAAPAGTRQPEPRAPQTRTHEIRRTARAGSRATAWVGATLPALRIQPLARRRLLVTAGRHLG